ncbi:hypothetical protein, partial [Enterobacter cloacae complex sp. P13RS]|uniref:hypothetical protein n=1 Tax=Enterobacter cloacae complex sp. P13RS TaxID=2779580 RepID=UPI001EEFC5EB
FNDLLAFFCELTTQRNDKSTFYINEKYNCSFTVLSDAQPANRMCIFTRPELKSFREKSHYR